jgi:2-phosphoglycerate kinase
VKGYFFIEPNNWNDKIDSLTTYLINPENPIIIFISGAAGLGKSSVSMELCHLLGIRNLICTDTLRYILASKEEGKPLLRYFSHECWKYYDEHTENNMISGFRKQSKLICDAVDNVLQDAYRHKKNTIIEGIHILPSIMLKKQESFPDLKMVFIYLTTDFDYFKNVLLPNRTVSSYRHLTIDGYDCERLSRFLVFHKMWIDEFESNNIKPIRNCSSPENLTENILQRLIEEIGD